MGLSYHTPDPTPPPGDGALRGRVSRYAWGRDYHRVMERRAKALVASLEALGGGAARFYVDYGPMPDRAAAQRAGLGWFGKNTNILTSEAGSWVFLAEILTDLDLEPDEPLKKNCGSCIACIPACPTDAIPAPYVIDNTRCISYHTIENRGTIPQETCARTSAIGSSAATSARTSAPSTTATPTRPAMRSSPRRTWTAPIPT